MHNTERSLDFHWEPWMLENLFKSWSLICFGIQQHINNVLHLCLKKEKIDDYRFISASSSTTFRAVISLNWREMIRNPKILPLVDWLTGASSFMSRRSSSWNYPQRTWVVITNNDPTTVSFTPWPSIEGETFRLSYQNSRRFFCLLGYWTQMKTVLQMFT